jgi:hypothetical protein
MLMVSSEKEAMRLLIHAKSMGGTHGPSSVPFLETGTKIVSFGFTAKQKVAGARPKGPLAGRPGPMMSSQVSEARPERSSDRVAICSGRGGGDCGGRKIVPRLARGCGGQFQRREVAGRPDVLEAALRIELQFDVVGRARRIARVVVVEMPECQPFQFDRHFGGKTR